jgi:hypothetical protein
LIIPFIKARNKWLMLQKLHQKSLLKQSATLAVGYIKSTWPYTEDQFTPPEAIVGAFEVDQTGALTGKFEENKDYRSVKTASRKARDYMQRVRPPHQCNQWVIEIDPKYDDQFPDVPPEGQIGRWYVGSDGRLTGQFRPNPHYKGSIKT